MAPESLHRQIKPLNGLLTVGFPLATLLHGHPFQALAQREIIGHQNRRYPGCDFNDSVHYLQYTRDGWFCEATSPRLKWTHISQIEYKKAYLIEYRGLAFNAGDVEFFIEAATDVIGYGPGEEGEGPVYDYLELIPYLVGEKLGYNSLPVKLLEKIFGLGKKNMVCSAFGAFLWTKYATETGRIKRPFNLLVEMTAVSSFLNEQRTPFRLKAPLYYSG